MIRRCSEKKKETIKINTSIPSCHCTMQKATFSCFLRFLTFPIEFGFLILKWTNFSKLKFVSSFAFDYKLNEKSRFPNQMHPHQVLA